jgi:DNA-binding NarL/FixJ family response regulator
MSFMSLNLVKILLVDDHQLMLKGLQLQLEQAAGLEVTAAVSTGKQALDFVLRTELDLAVVDLQLPDITGIELTRRLLAERPAIKVVMLTSDASIESVKEAIRAGVGGYILKENTDQELVKAIQEVLTGNLYLCPRTNAAVLEDYKQSLMRVTRPFQPELSSREREVLEMIAEGLRNKEMAVRLNIGVKSVETYRRRLMEKLHIDSTAELTQYAVREGIITL